MAKNGDNLFSIDASAILRWENLDELNYLASKLEELGESEYEHFQAAMEISDYTEIGRAHV